MGIGLAGTVGASGKGFSDLWNEGLEGDKTYSNQNSRTTSGINLRSESELEKAATGDISSQYGFLKDFLSRGPGSEAIDASNTSQNDFVRMLKGINANGGMPTDEDRRQANIFADDLFKPQQEALNQSFTQQNEDAARLAARLNRPVNDPIIQAKLRQEQMRQSAMLGADRAAFTSQEVRNSPFRRLELQGQLADAQGALASQAMANRMQLLNLGNALQSQERNWRLQTGERYGTSNMAGETKSGGGLMGGIGAYTGLIGGITNIGNSGLSAFNGGSGQSQPAYSDRGSGQMNFATPQSMQFAPAGYGYNGAAMNDIQASYMTNRGQSPARASRLQSGGGKSGGGLFGGGMGLGKMMMGI